MAISIVSKQYGDDSQTPQINPSVDNEVISPVIDQTTVVETNTMTSSENQDNVPLEQNIGEANTITTQPTETNSIENNDNGRLNELHPEETHPLLETPAQEITEPVIPNMYIQADQESMNIPSDVAIFSDEKKELSDGGFDMDDLLGDNMPATDTQQAELITQKNPVEVPQANTDATQTTTQDPFVQKKEELVEQKNPIQDTTKQGVSLPKIAPKKSLTKSLAMAAAGLFGVVVVGFVVMTMFPAGLDGTVSQESVFEEDILTQEPILEETKEDHAAADIQEEPKTPQEIARAELVTYSTLGEEYYTLGRDLKDRNMVRYALYVEKKAKDLIDMLDLDPNMDTKDIVVYFAQFDDYLKTLDEWKATLGDTLPVSGSPTIVEEDILTQPTPFTDIPTNYYNDENLTGGTQSGTLLPEPEQSELSDG